MPNHPTTNNCVRSLGDFVRRVRKDKHLSLTDVSNQSARFGKRITASYVNRIENDPQRKVTADRVVALAHGLGVPVEELLARAVGIFPATASNELELLARFKELPPERKEDVLKIVDLWYSERADFRSERKPALTRPTPKPVKKEESTMQSNGSKDYEGAAKATIDLVDHLQTPTELSDAVLETLIIMAYELEVGRQTRINIWHRETGLSKESLAALYRLYETGAGYRRSRLYADYEIGRMEKDHES